MSWNKSFVIPSGTSQDQRDKIIFQTPVEVQPNPGYDVTEHRDQVDRAREVARILVHGIGDRRGKDISVTLAGHTQCGEADWGGSISVSVCHTSPPKA